ncbi:MAG: SH3 domain-containing protein [Rhodobacteraceae bacterium]|nr:SH3 domain-containing protein [Paracoccaceae bacterium]
MGMKDLFLRTRWAVAAVLAVALTAAIIFNVDMAAVRTAMGAIASPSEPEAVDDGIVRGRITGFPVPRYVSMKAGLGWSRRGPGTDHRVDYEYTGPGVPLQVIGEFNNWRQVRDATGREGWMHHSLLSGERFVIVTAESASLMRRPEEPSAVGSVAEKHVIAKLDRCNPDWCRISVGRFAGWVRKSDIWGVDADEIL